MRVACLCLFSISGAPRQETPPASALVEQARTLIPEYTGEHRSFLTSEQRTSVLAGAKMLDEALRLEPKDAEALRWRAHTQVLLGEDHRNRGEAAEALACCRQALIALDASIELDPRNYSAHYSRGVACTDLGDYWQAIDSFGRAVELATEVVNASENAGEANWWCFHARKWKTAALMRAQEHKSARAEWRSFFADYGNNRWDLGVALAQSHLQERDLAGCLVQLEELVAAFPNEAAAREEMGYLAGLVGDRQEAARWLGDAIAREVVPTLYPRLWLCILAPEGEREAAQNDLLEFTTHPPASLSAWDQRLGRFILGQEDVESFLDAARAEEVRRKEQCIEIDDLPGEAWFYAGLRFERNGAPARALDAYQRALGFSPVDFKWEWEYARLYFARLARELGLAADPGFAVDGDRIALGDEEALRARDIRTGRLLRASWHAPGSESPVATLLREPRPGDLLQCVVQADDGKKAALRLVVGAR